MAPNNMLRALPLSLLLLLTACGEPLAYFAGGRLAGEEVPLAERPASGGIIQLETRPDDPYSVNIGYVVEAGQLYIDPAPDRRWYQHIVADPLVRIRFDGSNLIHPMVAIRETDPDILTRFDPERIILRLEPR